MRHAYISCRAMWRQYYDKHTSWMMDVMDAIIIDDDSGIIVYDMLGVGYKMSKTKSDFSYLLGEEIDLVEAMDMIRHRQIHSGRLKEVA